MQRESQPRTPKRCRSGQRRNREHLPRSDKETIRTSFGSRTLYLTKVLIIFIVPLSRHRAHTILSESEGYSSNGQ